MGELTIQTRMISLKNAKSKIRWFEHKERLPRKKKKQIKNRGEWLMWRSRSLVKEMYSYEDKGYLLDFITKP